jgi:uncharacterized membrane protein affecting hemolysin expression
MTEGGATSETTMTLLPNSRTTIDAAALLNDPDASGPLQRFAVIVDSLGSPGEPIVVESSVYSNSGGIVWRAGSNTIGTRLR